MLLATARPHLARTLTTMAALTRVTATTKEAFEAALAAHAGKEAKLLVLFSGATDAAGVSWCPDCDDAKPVIEAALAKAGEPLVLVTVPLDRAEYKGNAAHWARVHPAVKLQRIPTLYRWAANGKRPSNALIEDECKSAAGVAELIESDD